MQVTNAMEKAAQAPSAEETKKAEEEKAIFDPNDRVRSSRSLLDEMIASPLQH